MEMNWGKENEFTKASGSDVASVTKNAGVRSLRAVVRLRDFTRYGLLVWGNQVE